MAMMDYGAIAFKNGKLMTKEFFGDMKEMVGWEDTETDLYESRAHTDSEPNSDYMKPIDLNKQYFAYIGDKDCIIAFYKTYMRIACRDRDDIFYCHDEYFAYSHYTWSKWEYYAGEGFAKVKVTKRNGYFVCKWKYRGDKYKVYFGYGVDIDYYLKWHIVNYYRSPEYRLRRMIRWLVRR
jgi:hypothetical protein